MIRRFLAATAMVAACAFPVQAQELAPEPAPAGTAEGARALRQALAAYITDVPFDAGFLRIEPDPAGQRVTLDPASLFSDVAGRPVRFAPYSVLLSPRPDGDWNVFSRDPIDFAFQVELEGQLQSFEYRQGQQVFKGIFSPALAAFREGEAVASDGANLQSDAATMSSSTVSETVVTTSALPGRAGGVDAQMRQTMRSYQQTVEMKTPPATDGAQPGGGDSAALAAMLSFGFGAAEIDASASLTDGRTVAILDLYALVLRHAEALSEDPKAALAGPLAGELRTALRDLLPLWESVEGTVSVRDASIASAFGTFGFATASQTMRMTGVAENAGFEADFALRGIEAVSGALPDWAAGLVPQEVEIGFALSGVDLKTPADLALADLDLSKEPPLPPETLARIEAGFDPSTITMRLKPSRLRSADLDLSLSGDFALAGAKPAGSLDVEASGLDKVIATLQAAAQAQPELHQSVGMLQIAKGFARPKGDDRLEWVVETAADGSVTVNGTMLKGPDPVEVPAPEPVPPSDPTVDDGKTDL